VSLEQSVYELDQAIQITCTILNSTTSQDLKAQHLKYVLKLKFLNHVTSLSKGPIHRQLPFHPQLQNLQYNTRDVPDGKYSDSIEESPEVSPYRGN